MSKELSNAARLMGRKGGPIGGAAAARNMTPEQRVARAKKASEAAKLLRSKHSKEIINGHTS